MQRSMRKALIVGIDNYSDYPLDGCVNDAKRLTGLLERNEDGSKNFHCTTLLAGSDEANEADLMGAIKALFGGEAPFALFHFSGHGAVNDLGGYLSTQDGQQHDQGVRLTDVIDLANKSPVREILIILDSCFSGAAGNLSNVNNTVQLREGVSILTAARDSQLAMEDEEEEAGVFSLLLASALEGGAADVLGRVTVASLYAYVDQAFGPQAQRPLFKAHLSSFASIRNCKPALEPQALRALTEYFEKRDTVLSLDPSFEPKKSPKSKKNEAIFAGLQKMRAARLVEPVSEEHLYYEAINKGGCKLTRLGQFYWRLVNSDLI
jgi:hypothetical protein